MTTNEGEITMKKEVTALKFYLRNGETWTIKKEYIGDLWIKQISKSFGRIGDGELEEIYPCESLKIEILPDADQVNSADINLGGLELGMFERITKQPDIEKMDILYAVPGDNTNHEINEKDRVYFPYQAGDVDGNDNDYQTGLISEDGHLFVVIDPNKTAEEIYSDK